MLCFNLIRYSHFEREEAELTGQVNGKKARQHTHHQCSVGHQTCAVEGAGQEPQCNDNVLRLVQHIQGGDGLPLTCLHSESTVFLVA